MKSSGQTSRSQPTRRHNKHATGIRWLAVCLFLAFVALRLLVSSCSAASLEQHQPAPPSEPKSSNPGEVIPKSPSRSPPVKEPQAQAQPQPKPKPKPQQARDAQTKSPPTLKSSPTGSTTEIAIAADLGSSTTTKPSRSPSHSRRTKTTNTPRHSKSGHGAETGAGSELAEEPQPRRDAHAKSHSTLGSPLIESTTEPATNAERGTSTNKIPNRSSNQSRRTKTTHTPRHPQPGHGTETGTGGEMVEEPAQERSAHAEANSAPESSHSATEPAINAEHGTSTNTKPNRSSSQSRRTKTSHTPSHPQSGHGTEAGAGGDMAEEPAQEGNAHAESNSASDSLHPHSATEPAINAEHESSIATELSHSSGHSSRTKTTHTPSHLQAEHETETGAGGEVGEEPAQDQDAHADSNSESESLHTDSAAEPATTTDLGSTELSHSSSHPSESESTHKHKHSKSKHDKEDDGDSKTDDDDEDDDDHDDHDDHDDDDD